MATLFHLPRSAPLYAGASLPGAQLFFFQSGTTTPISTYTTPAVDVVHDHPVEADADGVFPAIYINESTNQSYRVQLKTSAGVLKYDEDAVQSHPATVELGTSNDTTISRASAGIAAVEGHPIATTDQIQTISAIWAYTVEIQGQKAASETGAAFKATNLVPAYRFRATGGATGEKEWQWVAASAGTLSLQTLDDDSANAVTGLLVNRTGTAIDDFRFSPAAVEALRIDANATAGNTRLMIYDVDNATLERVSVGAADSGGSGFKLLRIPN